MDKTVRLWDMSSKSCLKIFSHSDYVTCIQFNPVDDRYFISGSLDGKVRIWSIPDRQVVDWNDLHEMVTAACYTPDGQGALVGSYKGSCRLYNTKENKLQQKSQINLENKKKKSHHKKITGFQFAPGSSSEVLITSADSRIRVLDGVDLVHKFKGMQLHCITVAQVLESGRGFS
ncbi:WD repeat-containing 44-like [Olea europaea subsp. europaea]|uniref:WD repeat-containing 44-like n=1 Tax=Olea europaea subsp. europaea TaxID=158383 RepID=A0A8S0UID7_OLEEU|nr:WD repeat-containing 44-like [Olea europaea subsp. europaea]